MSAGTNQSTKASRAERARARTRQGMNPGTSRKASARQSTNPGASTNPGPAVRSAVHPAARPDGAAGKAAPPC
jgi:hypothetical protein